MLVYIFLQLIWWAYLLYDLNVEVYALRQASGAELPSGKLWMILGEAAVFMTFLIFGTIYIQRRISKDIEINTRQKNFMMAITHELRSPLASVRLQLETLIRRQLDPVQTRSITEKALADTDRLEMLTDKILLSYQIDEAGFRLHPEVLDLREVLQQLIPMIPITDEKRQWIRLKVDQDARVKLDRQAIHSIIINLIENAFKYAGDKMVEIDAGKKGNEVYIRVADQGPGIALHERGKIFNRFYRIGSEETRASKGTGLGLYIVRHLVEKQGGRVRVEENQPKGTIFVLSFPAGHE